MREHATEIVRQVRVKGASVQITYRGKVVAQLTPVREAAPATKGAAEVWTNLDQLAEEIGGRWETHVGAVEAVREGRREL